MPTVDEILSGLREVANNWKVLAIFWHVYFGAAIVALVFGRRPSKKTAGLLLALPIFSVGAIAWISANPFNGIVFALAGILIVVFSIKLRSEKAQTAPAPFLIPGALMCAFGWIYPHFLETSSFLPYLYSAPIGLVPCATLSIVVGTALVLNGLGSRAICIVLGVMGLFYGMTGVAQLKVAVDWALLTGAAIILVLGFFLKSNRPSVGGRATTPSQG